MMQPAQDFTCDQCNLAGRQINMDVLQLWLLEQNPDVFLCSDPPWFLRTHDFHSTRHTWLRPSQDALAGIFIRSDIPHQILPLPVPTNRVLAISLRTTIGELVLISTYLQHTSGAGLEALEAAILLAKRRTSLILIGGDLNGHSAMWSNQEGNQLGHRIEDLIIRENLTVLNSPEDEASFRNSRGHESWIDVSLGSHRIASLLSQHQVLADAIPSDHALLRTRLTLGMLQHPPRKTWKWNDTDWSTFQARLQDRLPEGFSSEPLDTKSKIDQAVFTLSKAILDTREELVPVHMSRAKPKPWFTRAVRAKYKLLRSAANKLTKAQRKSRDGQASADIAARYSVARRSFEAEAKAAKQACFQDFCAQIRPNVDMWDKFKQLQGCRHIESIPALRSADSLITDPAQKADLLLRTFFPGAIAKVDHNHPPLPEPQSTTRVTLSPDEQLTHLELLDVLGAARRTAPGRDEIPVVCWQACAPLLSPILLNIYNSCLCQKYYPEAWKHAQILPLPKGTKNRADPNSWRPISLLCNVGKFLEKIMQRRLARWLDQTQALNEAQHGFRRGRSTESALHALTAATLSAFNRRKQILAVSLDITKAFDSVPHPPLLNRLQALQAPPYLVDFLGSFLLNRSATLLIDNVSQCVTVPRGVPQGSSLSPTLFAIYINSLADQIQAPTQLLMYADDCLLFQEIGRHPSDALPLQNALHKVAQWGTHWDLSFNAAKTQLCRFSRLRKTHPIALQQGSSIIEEKPMLKYLGLDIDAAWTFIGHLKSKKIICQRRLAQIRRLSHSLWGSSPLVTKRLVDSCVLPACLYGSSVFGPLSRGRSSRMQILLSIYRAGGLLTTGAHRTTSTSAILQLSGNHFPDTDILARIVSSRPLRELPTAASSKKSTYQTPADLYLATTRQIAQQQWIPLETRKRLQQCITRKSSNSLLRAATSAYLSNLDWDTWQNAPQGEGLKQTHWTKTGPTEKQWWKHYSRRSMTRLSRFLSDHFPTRAYLTRFHCIEDSSSDTCRLGCPATEDRLHLLSCPFLAHQRQAAQLSEKTWPCALSFDFLNRLDHFLFLLNWQNSS